MINDMVLYTTKIVAVNMEAEDTVSYIFEKPKGFEYKAGQYIRVVLDSEARKRDSRYFSLSSAPYEKFLQITVKIKQSPFRDALYELEEGLSISFYGPIGIFTPDTQGTGKYIMLSGGVGVAPFFSMIKQIAYNRAFIDVFFLGSYKTTKDLLFEDELRMIGEKSKGHIKVWHTLTRMFPVEERKHFANFKTMLTTEAKHMGDPLWLISGSEQMVNDIYKFVLDLGVSTDKIFTEKFI